MAKKVRERAELEWLVAAGREFKISLDTLQPLYVAFLDHIFPEVEKSTPEERDQAYQRIFDYVEGLEPNAEMTVSEGVRIAHLKEKSRSDRFYVRKTMQSMGQLDYAGKQSERFVKRLTDGTKPNGNGAARDDTATPDGAAK
ncbi:MAG: hypothetical protein J2P48_06910 [Alphaproteobacteria bacterium]|nr:hypothetical protein [Alphaproteobacteria bacterium]